jgi:hypothetical protein
VRLTRRTRTRTILVACLDRQMAEAEAIGRAVASGVRWARVVTAERVVDPDGGGSVWRIVLNVPRTRRGDES